MNVGGTIAELFDKCSDDVAESSENVKGIVYKRNRLLEEFRDNITKDDNQLLDEILLMYNDVLYEENKNSFVFGFSLAIQLMSESIENELI